MELMCVKIKFGKDGLVPVIVQDEGSSAVLSLFYANAEAIGKMNDEGYVWRYSRRMGRLSKKGEVSGNCQKIVSMKADCDSDALLVKVKPEGPACHTGEYSCFGETKSIIPELTEVIAGRKRDPKKGSYVSGLVNDREKIIDKLREELEELIDAGGEKDIAWEAADLLFFMLVYLENREVEFSRVLKELERRRREG